MRLFRTCVPKESKRKEKLPHEKVGRIKQTQVIR